MRYQPMHAAPVERVPFTLWGPKPLRTALSAAVASVVGLVPVVMVSSPAQAAITGITVMPATQEVAEGRNASFTLTNTTGADINVTQSVTAGTASPADYTATGAFSQTTVVPQNGNIAVTLPIVADNDLDDGETVTVTFASGGETQTATVTIRDVGFTLTGSTVSETVATPAVGNTPAVQRTTRITATLADAAPAAVEIPLTLEDANDTATSGTEAGLNTDRRDYSYTTSTIAIAPGSTSGYVDITVYDDIYDEEDTEYVTVVAPLAGRRGASRLNSTADATRVNITDNDATPTVSIGGAGAVTEGGTLPFPLTLSGPSERPVSVKVNTMNGISSGDNNGAVTPADYDPLVNETVNVPPYNTAALVLVDTKTDNLVEGPEKLSAMISAPMHATVVAPATAEGSINDGNPAPRVKVSTTELAAYADPATTAFPEGNSGSVAKTLYFRLEGPSTIPVRIDYSFGGGTATKGTDYTGTDGTLVIPAGQVTGSVQVNIVGDLIHEFGNETFNVTLANSNSTVDLTTPGPIRAFTITDDDSPAPTYDVDNISVDEGNSGVAMAKVPVTLNKMSNRDITFSVSAADTNTAGTPSTNATESGSNATTTPGADDYNNPANTLTIPAGSMSAWVEVPVNGDVVYEKDQTLAVTVTPSANQTDYINSVAAQGDQHTATVTIRNDDAAPKVTFNEVSGTEGTSIRPVATIVGVSEYAYTLNASWGGEGNAPFAASANDVSASGAPANPINITRNTTQAPIPLGELFINQDTLDEPAEGWAVTLTEAGNQPTGFATSKGVYTFNDDPGDLPRSAAISDETIQENEQSVDLTVSTALQGDTTYSSQPLNIAWWTEDGTAKQGEDYTKRSGTLTIGADETSKDINIPILNDEMFENDETFYVKLGTITPNGAIVTKSTGKVVILSDDAATEPSIMAPASIKGTGPATISGMTTPNTAVELWAATVDGSFTKVNGGDTTSNSAGQYSFTNILTAPRRFKVAANGLESDVKLVKIQQVPVLTVSSTTRGVVNFVVKGNPLAAGQTVAIERRNANGTWTVVSRGTTSSTKSLSTSVRNLRSGQTWSFRAMIAGSAAQGTLSGYSAIKSVRVR